MAADGGVQRAAPPNSAVLVDAVKLVPLAAWASGTLPDVAQERVSAPLARVTASLKVTARLPAGGNDVAPLTGVVLVTTGNALGAVKLWLLLQVPKVWVAEVRQVKFASPPLPLSCRDVPAAVVPVSETGRLTLVRPAAGPSLAVMAPS